MKLLDTTFLVHYWGGVDDVANYLDAHEDQEFATTTLNLKELAVGRTLQDALDRHELRSAFGWVTVLPFGVEEAFQAARLEAPLHRDPDINRDKINALGGDLLVAAVAREHDAPVVTENTDDFERFDGVAVESYR